MVSFHYKCEGAFYHGVYDRRTKNDVGGITLGRSRSLRDNRLLLLEKGATQKSFRQ